MTNILRKLTAKHVSYFEVACFCAIVLTVDNLLYAFLSAIGVKLINDITKGVCYDK